MNRNRIALVALGVLLAGSISRAGELDGKWRHGSWTDTNTGHEHALRARFREKADGNYRVVFTGRFAKVVPFRFTTTLNVVGHDGDKVIMAGESRIAGLMRFSYTAVADECTFNAQYHSRRWTGEFHLTR
jgi:hypothetical protein